MKAIAVHAHVGRESLVVADAPTPWHRPRKVPVRVHAAAARRYPSAARAAIMAP